MDVCVFGVKTDPTRSVWPFGIPICGQEVAICPDADFVADLPDAHRVLHANGKCRLAPSGEVALRSGVRRILLAEFPAVWLKDD